MLNQNTNLSNHNSTFADILARKTKHLKTVEDNLCKLVSILSTQQIDNRELLNNIIKNMQYSLDILNKF